MLSASESSSATFGHGVQDAVTMILRELSLILVMVSGTNGEGDLQRRNRVERNFFPVKLKMTKKSIIPAIAHNRKQHLLWLLSNEGASSGIPPRDQDGESSAQSSYFGRRPATEL